MFESKTGIFFIAGLFFFALSFVVMGVLPWTIHQDGPVLSVEELAAKGIPHEFVQLAERFPDQFKAYYGDVTYDSFGEALKLGHRVYVAEGCWHCHSQRVRSVSKDDLRWGPVSHAREYQNVLQRPVLFGRRRVGPDLIREAGRRSNDWHIAHFYKPTSVSPVSVMPEYKWFFDEQGVPNKKGMAVIAYVQWLGSWLDEYPYWGGHGPSPARGEPKAADGPVADAQTQGKDQP